MTFAKNMNENADEIASNVELASWLDAPTLSTQPSFVAAVGVVSQQSRSVCASSSPAATPLTGARQQQQQQQQQQQVQEQQYEQLNDELCLVAALSRDFDQVVLIFQSVCFFVNRCPTTHIYNVQAQRRVLQLESSIDSLSGALAFVKLQLEKQSACLKVIFFCRC